MASGHPYGLPDLFLDRSLGRRRVPDLLRATGLRLRTLAEVYGIPADEAVADVAWLALAGDAGWPVLMKDSHVRYRPAERAMLIERRVQAFCLTSGNLVAPVMADRFLAVIDDIAETCLRPGPFLYAVSGRGLRMLDLD